MNIEIIRPDGTREPYEYKTRALDDHGRLREMYDIITGDETDPSKRCHTVEHIAPKGGCHMWMDEDGIAHGLPMNHEATKIYHEAGGFPDAFVVGNVILETPKRAKGRR